MWREPKERGNFCSIVIFSNFIEVGSTYIGLEIRYFLHTETSIEEGIKSVQEVQTPCFVFPPKPSLNFPICHLLFLPLQVLISPINLVNYYLEINLSTLAFNCGIPLLLQHEPYIFKPTDEEIKNKR